MSEKTTKCLVWLLPAGSRAAPPNQRAAPPKAPWWKPEGHLRVSDEEPWGFDKQIAKSSPRGPLSQSKIPRFDMFGNAFGKSKLPAPTCRRFLRSAARSMLRPQAARGGLRPSEGQTGRQLLPGRARLLERFQRLPGLAGFGEAGALEGLLELAPGLFGLALAGIDQAEVVMDGRQAGRRLGG